MQTWYLVAAVLGALVPGRYLLTFLVRHGLDVPLLVRQLFENDVSAFFGTDVIISSLVLWLFVFSEGRRLGMKRLWIYVACNLAIGVSLALPLFLYFREPKIER